MEKQEEINGYFMEAVRRLKRKYGYTQAYMVEKAELAQNAISKIKKGTANAGDDTITKLCNAFGLNPDFFYGRSPYLTLQEKEEAEIHSENSQMMTGNTPDTSSMINAIISAQMQTIESLKGEKSTLLESHARELRIKDELIASLRQQLQEKSEHINILKERLAEYRRLVDSKIGIIDYPFPVGSAEHRDIPLK